MSENSPETVTMETARTRGTLTFRVYEGMPWHMAFIFAVQLILSNMDSVLAMAYITYNAICPGDDVTLMSEFVALGFINMGISSFFMNVVGNRLPFVQVPSFVFAVTITSSLSTSRWACPLTNHTALQDHGMNATESVDDPKLWMPRVQALTGGLIIGSLVQVLLGATGLLGVVLRFTGPLTIVPAVTLMGISVIESFIPAFEEQWGIGLLTGGLILIFTTLLGRFSLPVPVCSRKDGCRRTRFLVFRIFPHFLAVSTAWILSYILTVTGVFAAPPGSKGHMARTDAKINVLTETSWFILPYPGRWGMPSFSVDTIVVMVISVICNLLESVASTYIVARIIEVPSPPRYVINRAQVMEGLANAVAGLLGSPYGTVGASSVAGFISTTGNASRTPRLLMSLIVIIAGVIGKFGAVLSMIPDPIIGGMSSFTVSIIISVGISGVMHIDLKSFRNLIVLGVTFFLGLVIPTSIRNTRDQIKTGNDIADVTLEVLLSNIVLVGALSGFILDNLIPGTEEERGLIKFHNHGSSAADQVPYSAEDQHVYDLPCGSLQGFVERHTCRGFVPFCPGYRPDMYDCRCKKPGRSSPGSRLQSGDNDVTNGNGTGEEGAPTKVAQNGSHLTRRPDNMAPAVNSGYQKDRDELTHITYL